MSATRNILNKLERVEPTQSLLITPMPCEKTCAMIRNSTVDSMETANTAKVAYRYMQNNAGASNTLFEAGIYSACVLVSIVEAALKPEIALLAGVMMLAEIAHILPNVNNTLRYRETRDACAEWLEGRLSPEKLEQIKALKYNEAGIKKLVDMMRDEHVDLSFIEQKAQTKDDPFPCWQLVR